MPFYKWCPAEGGMLSKWGEGDDCDGDGIFLENLFNIFSWFSCLSNVCCSLPTCLSALSDLGWSSVLVSSPSPCSSLIPLSLWPSSWKRCIWTLFLSFSLSLLISKGRRKKREIETFDPPTPPPPPRSAICENCDKLSYLGLFCHFIMDKMGQNFHKIEAVRLERGDRFLGVFFTPSLSGLAFYLSHASLGNFKSLFVKNLLQFHQSLIENMSFVGCYFNWEVSDLKLVNEWMRVAEGGLKGVQKLHWQSGKRSSLKSSLSLKSVPAK